MGASKTKATWRKGAIVRAQPQRGLRTTPSSDVGQREACAEPFHFLSHLFLKRKRGKSAQGLFPYLRTAMDAGDKTPPGLIPLHSRRAPGRSNHNSSFLRASRPVRMPGASSFSGLSKTLAFKPSCTQILVTYHMSHNLPSYHPGKLT